MPKRSKQDKIERYQRKIRKLETHEDRKRKRIIHSSPSEDSDNYSDNEQLNGTNPEPLEITSLIGTNDDDNTGCDSELRAVPELNPDILSALGDATEDMPQFGPKIHEKLSGLWLPILRKGLSKESKAKLVKEYQVPENCSLLQAPKLNPEISAAITDGTRARDKRVEEVQQQLGLGISALNKGLELLLDDGTDRVQAIKFLSDSCRILCDLHHVETEARKKFITPGLDKSFLHVMQDVDRDEMLFGKKLSDKIKATKVIEKHGLQIKKPASNPKVSSFHPSTSRSRPQGNWGGPSRFPSNRGGRGGHRKTAPQGRRVQSIAVPQKPLTLNKQRAAPQQQ